ncbi:acyl-CoA N-acyltransferase [Fennellomyces sp. T-0311]|nr:acyl-CoA N-acyltransferase [Fennellomyces sp. T-0311]
MVQKDSIYIRQITPDDSGHIQTIVTVINRAYRGGDGWTSSKDLIIGNRIELEGATTLLEDQCGTFLCAFHGRNVVGTIRIDPVGESECILRYIAVQPEYQSQGLGTRLLYSAFEKAKLLGYTIVRIGVADARTDILQWYRRHGFQDFGEKMQCQTPQHLLIKKDLLSITLKRSLYTSSEHLGSVEDTLENKHI